MNRLLLSFLLFFFVSQLNAQIKDVEPLLFGKKHTLYSDVLKEDRTLLIYDPNEKLKRKKQVDRPVIYVLDGNDHYLNLVTLLINSGGEILPKMIVVGISQNDRTKDLSPKGFNQFSSYIKEEIFPYINKNFKTSNETILIGHSLGGLFTLNTFIQKNELFSRYISIDPYLVNHNIIPDFLKLSHTNDFKNKSLYISIARTFPENLSLEQAVNEKSEATEMVREIVKLVGKIDANKKKLHFKCDYFDDKTHTTVPNISINNGLNFFFNQ